MSSSSEPDASTGRLSGATLGKTQHKHLPKVSKFKYGEFGKRALAHFDARLGLQHPTLEFGRSAGAFLGSHTNAD